MLSSLASVSSMPLESTKAAKRWWGAAERKGSMSHGLTWAVTCVVFERKSNTWRKRGRMRCGERAQPSDQPCTHRSSTSLAGATLPLTLLLSTQAARTTVRSALLVTAIGTRMARRARQQCVAVINRGIDRRARVAIFDESAHHRRGLREARKATRFSAPRCALHVEGRHGTGAPPNVPHLQREGTASDNRTSTTSDIHARTHQTTVPAPL